MNCTKQNKKKAFLKVLKPLPLDSLDLIKKMLDRDIEKRISIDQILQHPWFHSLK